METNKSRRSTIKKIAGSVAILSVACRPKNLFAFGPSAIISKTVLPNTEVKPLWGATYFSAWNEGNKQVATMNHPDWYNRAPFYAELQSSEPYRLKIHSLTQAIIDQEILYASNYGLDYWAFYATDETQADRDLYLSSQYKNRMKWCQVQGYWGGEKSMFLKPSGVANEITRLVKLFSDAQYLKILENRPVFMWYAPGGNGLRSPDKIFGSDQQAYNFIADLGKACKVAGLGNPYVVMQHGDLGTAKKYMEAVGADAVTTYAVGALDFQKVMKESKWFCDLSLIAKVKVVPPLSCGWGGPHVKNWGGDGPFEDEGQPNLLQFRENLEMGRDFIKAHPESCPGGLTLIYNWSEYGEGGWLNADKSDGIAKLQVLKSVRNGTVAPVIWNFTFTTEGWKSNGFEQVGLSAKRLDGLRTLNCKSSGKGGAIRFEDQKISLAGLTRVLLKLKNGTAAKKAAVCFQVEDSFTKIHCVPFMLKKSEGAFDEYDIDLGKNSDWNGTLKSLVIDFGENTAIGEGLIEIDYIRLEPAPGIPEHVKNPFPADGLKDAPVSTGLSWIPGEGSVAFDVYLGTKEPLTLLRTTTGVSTEPGLLKPGTKYFWRVDSRNGNNKVSGPTFSFITHS